MKTGAKPLMLVAVLFGSFLNSILEFRAESAAEVKKLALEKIYDNSLLQQIQKETTH